MGSMAWPGEERVSDQHAGATGYVCRCARDRIGELLFACRQTLFSDPDPVFLDNTSVCLDGQGDQTRRGFRLYWTGRPSSANVVAWM